MQTKSDDLTSIAMTILGFEPQNYWVLLSILVVTLALGGISGWVQHKWITFVTGLGPPVAWLVIAWLWISMAAGIGDVEANQAALPNRYIQYVLHVAPILGLWFFPFLVGYATGHRFRSR